MGSAAARAPAPLALALSLWLHAALGLGLFLWLARDADRVAPELVAVALLHEPAPLLPAPRAKPPVAARAAQPTPKPLAVPVPKAVPTPDLAPGPTPSSSPAAGTGGEGSPEGSAASTAASRVYGEGEVDRAAAPAGGIHPRYPARQKMLGREAIVVLRATVGADGQVHDLAVVQSGGGDFDSEARAAAQAARFTPALRAGHAVASTVTLRVRFELE